LGTEYVHLKLKGKFENNIPTSSQTRIGSAKDEVAPLGKVRLNGEKTKGTRRLESSHRLGKRRKEDGKRKFEKQKMEHELSTRKGEEGPGLGEGRKGGGDVYRRKNDYRRPEYEMKAFFILKVRGYNGGKEGESIRYSIDSIRGSVKEPS